VRRAIALVIALCAVALAACGGSGGDSSASDARKLVEQTFGTAKPLTSGKLTIAAGITPHGLETDTGPIKLGFSGPFDRGKAKTDVPKFDFTLSGSLGGQTFRAGAASTGTAGFLSLGTDAYALPASEYASLKKSFAQLQSAAQPKTSGGKLDWLRHPRVEGDADVAGVATKHVTGDVDVKRLLTDVAKRQGSSGSSLNADQIDQATAAVQHPTFDFYTGKDDHVLRRVKLGFAVVVPEARRSQLGGLSSADVTLDYRVADLNTPQTVSAPADPKPISELTPRLQQLQQALSALGSGGLGGSGSSGSGTATTPGAGSSGGSVSEQAQKYADCLTAAGGNVTAQQKCAALLK
jgi:hypothetical protein